MKKNLEERIEGTGGIRDLINESWKHASLSQNPSMYLMLCSCLDTIGDTHCCSEAFLSAEIDQLDINNKYVYVYGTMQALYVEQDAVKGLCESLNIPYTPDSLLNDIRWARNKSVGHPTNSRGTYNFINRNSIGNQGFHLLTLRKDSTERSNRYINVPNLISKQREKLVDVLDNVKKILKEEKMKHQQRFIGQNLSSIFTFSGYTFEKIFESILNPESPHAEIAESHVDRILGIVVQFRAGVVEREGEDDSNSHMYEIIDYSLQQIKKYFQNPTEPHVNENDAYIFASFADRQIAELSQWAKQLDEKYSNESSESQ